VLNYRKIKLMIKIVHRLLRAREYQNRPQLSKLCKWWRETTEGV